MSVRWNLRLIALAACAATLTACGTSDDAATSSTTAERDGGFRSVDCNGIADADIAAAAGSEGFTKAVVSDAGCFWQENTMFGTVGAGMGISTWWYRGSDMDTERSLEQQAGRTLTELSVDGNKGFKAFDGNACSFYVAKGGDVITWSIQTMNPATLPDLCSVTEQLAELSQERVN
ncbi:lprB protein [Mycobacterium sp. GA-1285]|nr:lprB protein [Mycobacterium sp. GA-1285]